MPKMTSGCVAVAAALILSLAPAPTQAAPPLKVSPPGQLSIVTVNARQHRTLGVKRFTAMLELVKALRSRPAAFDGGAAGAVAPPDVVVVSEITAANADILQHMLKERFSMRYRIVGPADVEAVVIANTNTVVPSGEPTIWEDACANAAVLGETSTRARRYPVARFTESATGQPFTVAGVHLAKNYSFTEERNCHTRNVSELRRQLSGETAPVVIAGDFNKRAMTAPYECDPDERSEPLEWWLSLTAPTVGTAYRDAVHEWHRARGISLVDEWTHEQKADTVACDQNSRRRRTRIDFLFSSALVAEAHTDHPGWAGQEPGTRNPDAYKYSDHRFVWARFVIAGPPQPSPPTAAPGSGGVVQVAWSPVEGAMGWVVLRAAGDAPYDVIATLPAETTTFTDARTSDGVTYRYAIAAVGSDGAQGLESAPATATADASGPRVVRVDPRRGSTGIDPRATVEVVFDEAVAPESVTRDTIVLTTESGARVRGTVVQPRPRALTFDPSERLGKGTTYRVVVRPVEDVLGNRSSRVSWRFTTVERER